jgi:hypothetical protein
MCENFWQAIRFPLEQPSHKQKIQISKFKCQIKLKFRNPKLPHPLPLPNGERGRVRGTDVWELNMFVPTTYSFELWILEFDI